jgi:hypothetical protein
VSLADRFRRAMTEAYGQQGAKADLMPTVFTRACVDVLTVDGASLSLTEQLRVPLGASDALVARAEQVQTTLGEGPCLTATATATPLVVNLQAMAERWPLFHREVVAITPFRSVASIPFRVPSRSLVGALDLYSVEPEGAAAFASLAEINTAIVVPIASVLFEGPGDDHGVAQALPNWLEHDAASDRVNVWVAIGMLVEHARLESDDALAVLRGYAFSHGSTLDDVSLRLTSRELDPADVLD